MTLTEYQQRIESLLDQHLDNLDSEPEKALESYVWLMSAVNTLLTEYYGDMRKCNESA
jgi:hypothetical protein